MHIYLGMLYYDTNIQPHMETPRKKELDALVRLLSVAVRVCRSPQYTAPGCVPTSGAFDYTGMRACHGLCCRDSIHHISNGQGENKVQTDFVLSDNFASRSPLHPKILRE